MAVQWTLLALLLGGASYSDLKTRMIPNRLTLGAVVAGMAYHTSLSGLAGIIESCKGLSLGFGMFFLLYLCGAIGAGDVKLFAAIGSIAGISFVAACAFYAILFAGLIGIGILTWRKLLRNRISRLAFAIVAFIGWKDVSLFRLSDSERTRFPFMVAVLPAFATVVMERIWMTGRVL